MCVLFCTVCLCANVSHISTSLVGAVIFSAIEEVTSVCMFPVWWLVKAFLFKSIYFVHGHTVSLQCLGSVSLNK